MEILKSVHKRGVIRRPQDSPDPARPSFDLIKAEKRQKRQSCRWRRQQTGRKSAASPFQAACVVSVIADSNDTDGVKRNADGDGRRGDGEQRSRLRTESGSFVLERLVFQQLSPSGSPDPVFSTLM